MNIRQLGKVALFGIINLYIWAKDKDMKVALKYTDKDVKISLYFIQYLVKSLPEINIKEVTSIDI